jgi:hypothetical protein
MPVLRLVLPALLVLALASVPAVAAAAKAPAPHIGAIAPTAGPDKGANIVTVRGQHLGAVTAVAFGSARSSKITHRSASRLEVAAPAHRAGMVRMRLISSHGRSSSSVKYFYGPPPRLTVSAPDEIDPMRGNLYDLSCPTEEFCAAVDGGPWYGDSELVVLRAGQAELRTKVPSGVRLSCGTPSFCVAQGDSRASFWNGTTWSRFKNVGKDNPFLQWVSCAPGTTTCVGAGALSSLVYHGSSWASVAAPKGSDWLGSISCATATFCISASSSDSFKFDGTSWHEVGQPTGLDPGLGNDISISCPTTSFCLTADFFGDQKSRFDGSTWHKVGGGLTYSVGPSCAGPADCVAMGQLAAVASFYSASGFGPKQQVPGAHGGFVAASCVPGGSCVAIDRHGQIFRHTASGWSAGASLPVTGDLTSVSCVTTSWCMAVDARGNAVQGAGSHWRKPQRIDGFRELSAVSCSKGRVCAALDNTGHALIYKSGSWSKPQTIDPGRLVVLSGVDCTSTTRCLAVDTSGQVVEWNGTRWGAPAKIGKSFDGIDCPTANMCLVGGQSPAVLDQGKWTKIALPRGEIGVGPVTCLRSDYCVTGGARGFHVWHHRIWSGPIAYQRNTSFGPVGCVSDRVCMGGVTNDNEEFGIAFAGAAYKLLQAFGSTPPTAVSCLPDVECVAMTDTEARTITSKS